VGEPESTTPTNVEKLEIITGNGEKAEKGENKENNTTEKIRRKEGGSLNTDPSYTTLSVPRYTVL